jgi:hypothetical protein
MMEMETKSAEWLAAESRRVANLQIEVGGEIKEVKIRRTYPTGTGPNCEVLEFVPSLPPIAERAALDAISPLTGTYALA